MDRLHIPIFALNTVLFPGGVLPLRVFEARYMDMTRDCLRHDRPFGVCLIRAGKEVGTPATPETVGCLARITEWDMQQLGVLHLKALGGERFRIRSSQAGAQGLISADAEPIAAEERMPLPERYAACVRLLELVIADVEQPLFAQPYEFENAVWVGYRLAEILPLPPAAKQKLLELNDGLARLEILLRFIEQRGLAREQGS